MGDKTPKTMIVLCLLASLKLVGCSEEAGRPEDRALIDESTKETTPKQTAASSPALSAGVFFPKQEPYLDQMDAANGGKLTLDDKGCLRVKNRGGKDPYGIVPIWPSDFRLAVEGEDVRILEEGGRVVARVGEQVRMGGGEATESLGGMEERTARELRERCPGNFWIVGGEVRIP